MGMSHAIFENGRASNYDQFVTAWIPNYHYFIDLLPTLLEDQLGDEMLVVGCGTGNEISSIIRKDPKWKITGVDPSPEMVSQAREKLSDYPNVTLVDGRVSDLPGNESFGSASLLLVLHFLPDDGAKLALLKDISSRMKSGVNW